MEDIINNRYNKLLKKGLSSSDIELKLLEDASFLEKGQIFALVKYGVFSVSKARATSEKIKNFFNKDKDKKEEDNKKHPKSVKKGRIISNTICYIILLLATAVVLFPLLLVLVNSFKEKNQIFMQPFVFPTGELFVGFDNFLRGIDKTHFWETLGNSLIITVFSTMLIVLFSSMSAWFLTRVKTWWTKVIYYSIVFSMIVPFQMVMLSLSGLASYTYTDNIIGIIFIYVGFGAGLSTFMFSGFVKSIPIEIEEAAMVDGSNPFSTFFRLVFPILKPTSITVAILNVMWIWNDYLLPYLVLPHSQPGSNTLPVAIQLVMQGGYGDKDIGALMAMVVLTIIPIIIFYLVCQKYIIRGVVAGAVKG